METIKTKGFTAKDVFNSSSATPIKAIKEQTVRVVDVCVKEKADGETVGYLKAEDGTIYATISATVIEQVIALADMLVDGALDLKVVPKTSNQGREYFMLELQ